MEKRNLKVFIFFSLWSVFTLALLVWWVIFAFRQLDSIAALNLAADSELLRHQKMLIYEGITLFVCLAIGAAALLYFIFKENKSLRERKNFLSLFTHDLKTTISALRLMVERLVQKSEDKGLKSEAKEIQKIGTRLGQQLQNALQVSFESDRNLVMEKIDVCEQLNYIRPLWPDLSFNVEGDFFVEADSMAFRSLCINLIQNASDHAEASEIIISKNLSKKGHAGVEFTTPKAKGLPVSIENFKKDFRAFQSIDSSGVGLKLAGKMMDKMGGFVEYTKLNDDTLKVALFFKSPGAAI